MADVSHGRHSSIDDLYHNALTSIQLALGFIGVELNETGKINVEKKNPANSGAGS
jgi:hypothetical protein